MSAPKHPFHANDVSMSQSLTTSTLVAVVSAVVELVTHPALGDAASAGAGELTSTTALVH